MGITFGMQWHEVFTGHKNTHETVKTVYITHTAHQFASISLIDIDL